MELNHLAHALISFIPLIIAHFWYNSDFRLAKWANYSPIVRPKMTILKFLFGYIMSLLLIFGYMNLIIHQIGFYELFFTDIMRGSEEAKQIAETFLTEYGQKHRYFSHGFFHGIILAFSLCLPFIAFFAFLEEKGLKWIIYHFLFWLIVSVVCGGLIAEFV